MKKSLEVGMRVSVRRGGYAKPFKGKITHLNEQFNTVAVTEDGFYSNHGDSPFHPCQIKILVKKKVEPVKARRVWIERSHIEARMLYPQVRYDKDHESLTLIEFQEVLPLGTVTISREDLARAMKDAAHSNIGCYACEGSMAQGIERLAKALGFES